MNCNKSTFFIRSSRAKCKEGKKKTTQIIESFFKETKKKYFQLHEYCVSVTTGISHKRGATGFRSRISESKTKGGGNK